MGSNAVVFACHRESVKWGARLSLVHTRAVWVVGQMCAWAGCGGVRSASVVLCSHRHMENLSPCW